MGREGIALKRLARVSKAAICARAVGQFERFMGLCDYLENGPCSHKIRRPDSGSVCSGIVAIGRGQAVAARSALVGAPPLRCARGMEGRTRIAALWRGGL